MWGMIEGMTDRPKKKSQIGKSSNDSRTNRKAWKMPDGARNRKSPQDPLALVLMGKGQYVNIHRTKTKEKA